jgi:hypothetical protein
MLIPSSYSFLSPQKGCGFKNEKGAKSAFAKGKKLSLLSFVGALLVFLFLIDFIHIDTVDFYDKLR